jgi:NAD+ diphosphatase
VTFTPGIATTANEGRIYAIAGQALHVVRDSKGAGARVPHGPKDRALYLGMLDGEACFAMRIARGEAGPAGTEPVALRQLYGVLSDEEFAIAGRALGLTSWDHDHRFCGRCGAPTAPADHERVRICTSCKHGAYPKLAPAVIMLVERDGRALLARNAKFPMPFFSTLAGFVDVGETLEEAVAREVREETQIAITDVRYFGSQPWPFTGSLLIAFTARWAGGEIQVQPEEIAEADWFAPGALPVIPPALSIARALIDDFVRRHPA